MNPIAVAVCNHGGNVGKKKTKPLYTDNVQYRRFDSLSACYHKRTTTRRIDFDYEMFICDRALTFL